MPIWKIYLRILLRHVHKDPPTLVWSWRRSEGKNLLLLSSTSNSNLAQYYVSRYHYSYQFILIFWIHMHDGREMVQPSHGGRGQGGPRVHRSRPHFQGLHHHQDPAWRDNNFQNAEIIFCTSFASSVCAALSFTSAVSKKQASSSVRKKICSRLTSI